MANTTKTFKKPFNINNAQDYKLALEELNAEVNKVKKNITYLDVYNIIDSVTDKENLAAQINALTPNSSLVINTPPFYENEELYSTGDIIFKNYQGIVNHINAQSGGLYYPSKITTVITDGTNETNYAIEYSFSSSVPDIDNSSASTGSTVSAAKTITFNGLKSTKAGDSYIYGLWQPFGNGIFETQTYKDEVIEPYIKFYLVATSNDKTAITDIEEVSLDYTLSTLEKNGIDYWKIILTDDTDTTDTDTTDTDTTDTDTTDIDTILSSNLYIKVK